MFVCVFLVWCICVIFWYFMYSGKNRMHIIFMANVKRGIRSVINIDISFNIQHRQHHPHNQLLLTWYPQRRECKIFASGVTFSIFTHFRVSFTKTVEIRWNWRYKNFGLKIRSVKFWTQLMSAERVASFNSLEVQVLTNKAMITHGSINTNFSDSATSTFFNLCSAAERYSSLLKWLMI